mmetsp:Transcript_47728/g.91223  ORF Transcript_47728/g.91223 Transcript_47728/m.91223 type:complete len:232 (-) Transcript_47728:170-865(-)|eukprot:CAMPEP_0114227888 /NCGR_PEP_ID=MMETSP0058-20121206/2035_1 /TAXON_ID=36894 /ORGANISM="Pyramimonas parkeae, CCMP726" /LENGTH=231 /DNA_ID=CAMNT_0001338769 /DNA_START=72 /DNA_END=767 /DNA_ORIENTATION=-
MANFLCVKVIFIPGLMRHLAKGWTEDQLLTGRVHTLGKEEMELQMPIAANLGHLASEVELTWGVPVSDQAFRYHGTTLIPSKDSAKKLDHLGAGGKCSLLMSAGQPNLGTSNSQGLGGRAVLERDPTQVLTTTVETESSSDRHKDEGRGSEATRGSAHHSGQSAKSHETKVFSGKSYQLGSTSSSTMPGTYATNPSSPVFAYEECNDALEKRRSLAAMAASRRIREESPPQ